MLRIVDKIHFRFYSVALYAIVIFLGFFNLGIINAITVAGSLGILITSLVSWDFFIKNEDRFKLFTSLTVLVSLYSLVFQIEPAEHKLAYIILSATAIPLLSSFFKNKNNLSIFLTFSFVAGSMFFYKIESKEVISFFSFLAFLSFNFTIFLLNFKRITLEINDKYKKNNLESIIKSLPETLVRSKNNKFEVLKMSKAKFSEEMKEFIINTFKNTELTHAEFIQDSHFFNIKKVVTNTENVCLYYISDITQDIIKEKELEKNKQQLTNSSKLAALGEMAGGVAHEINNPLQILSLSVEQIRLLLEADKMDVVACEKVCEQMDSTIDRVNNIVKGMKLISRDGGQDPYEEVDIKQVVSETLSFCKEKFKNSGVKLLVYEEDHSSYKVLGQKVRISQVILNLLNNAFDAISKNRNKTIRVSLGHNNDNVIIAISDSGPGVPDELVEKIFQPFFTTKEIGKGTGLGLSISKGIIEQHKGSFYLDEDNRSKFIIKIPLAKKAV